MLLAADAFVVTAVYANTWVETGDGFDTKIETTTHNDKTQLRPPEEKDWKWAVDRCIAVLNVYGDKRW